MKHHSCQQQTPVYQLLQAEKAVVFILCIQATWLATVGNRLLGSTETLDLLPQSLLGGSAKEFQ